MDRRDFLKGAIAGAAAVVAAPAVGSPPPAKELPPSPRNVRPRNYRHVVWPLQTDFEGMKLIDPVAAEKYVNGYSPDRYDGQTVEEHVKDLRFARTETGGWVSSEAELGYNPRDKYWSYFEYDEYDGYEIFGRGPRHMGYDPEEPILLFHWTAEEAERHYQSCLTRKPNPYHPETHRLG